MTSFNVIDVAMCPGFENGGKNNFLLACDNGLVLAKYDNYRLTCQAHAVYLIGLNLSRIVLANSERNLYFLIDD